MYHVVTSGLYLPSNVFDVSQAVDLGEDNAVLVQIWVDNVVTSALVNDIDLWLEASDDLENWVTTSVVSGIIAVPSITVFDSAAQPLLYRFVRLKYQGGNRPALLTAAITTGKNYT